MLQDIFNNTPLAILTFLRDLFVVIPIPLLGGYCFLAYVFIKQKPKAIIPIANWCINHGIKLSAAVFIAFIMFAFYNFTYYNYLTSLYSGAIVISEVSAKGAQNTDEILNSPNYELTNSEREDLTAYIQILRARGLLSEDSPTVKTIYETSIALFKESDDFHN